MLTAWLVVPLAVVAGSIAWSRLPPGAGETDDPIETVFASLLCAVFLIGSVALFLAELASLRPHWLSAGLAVVGVGSWRVRRPEHTRARLSRWTLVIVVLFSMLAAASLAPASEDVLGGRDPGVYANVANWIAREGTVRIQSEPIAALAQAAHPAFHSPGVFIPGLYLTDADRGEIVPQFLHLLPVYMSVGHWLHGARGALLVPPVLGLLAELAVVLFVRRMLGLGAALIAGGVLVLNLAQIWGVRNPYSEGITQLGVFATLWSLSRAYETGGVRWGILGSVSLGLCFLVRVDSALLLAALIPAVVVVQGASSKPRRWATHAFIPIVLFLAAWGAVHARFWSYPYFNSLRADLRPLWGGTLVIVVVSLVALVAPSRLRRLLDWMYRRGRMVWAAAAVALVTAFALGMWVRPRIEPYEMLGNWGIRTYNEETLVRVGWYISQPGMVLGMLGTTVLLHLLLVRRRLEWTPFLSVFLAFSLLYFWDQRIHPDHPWAMRRFLPVVVPGICVALAAVVSWSWAVQGRWRWLLRLPALFVTSWVLFHEFSMARPFWTLRENDGALRQLSEFARHVPENSLMLFSYRGVEQRVAMPLALEWRRAVLPVTRDPARDPDGEKRRELFEAQVTSWLREGRDVRYLTGDDGHSIYLTHAVRWEPVTSFRLAVPTIGSRYEGPPRRTHRFSKTFHLFRAAPSVSDQPLPCAPTALRVAGPLVGTGQGLYGAEDHGRYRWARPESRLRFPQCDRRGAGRPHTLRIRAACDRRRDRCRVDVDVNDARAGTLELTGELSNHDLPMPPEAVREPIGAVVVRFRRPGNPAVSGQRTNVNERSFRLGAVTLLGGPGFDVRKLRDLSHGSSGLADLNLISDTAEVALNVRLQGFYRAEGSGAATYRWTQRLATLVVPVQGLTPSAIRVRLARSSHPENRIRITANGCRLFDGRLPQHEWETMLSLAGCRKIDDELKLSIESDVIRPPKDRRELGVAVRHVVLVHDM
jgi:hypothetical protein